jgi:DNA-binding transcriptional regulator YiaG
MGSKGNGKGIRWIREHLAYRGDDCLPWPYSKDARVGRGMLGYNGQQWWAHRLMCTLAHGEPPTPKHQTIHICGNGHLGCTNPRHLRWGTNAENQKDRRRHGTHKGAKGTRTRLTADQIAEIRKREKPQVQIAQDFGISLGCVQYWQGHDRPPVPWKTKTINS